MNAPRFFRCDGPTGPIVQLLGSAGEGWVKVKSLLRHVTFETRLDRLFPL